MAAEARDIYREACARIATEFGPDGYRYRISKQVLTSRDGDLTKEVSFQSSRKNFVVPDSNQAGFLGRAASWLPLGGLVTFGSVTLIAHAAVRSRIMKEWRDSLKQPLGVGDAVHGGQIGNLQDKPQWITFDLANPNRRDRVIRDIIVLIRNVALPFMDRFADPGQVIGDLLEGAFPWHFWEVGALEYVACFGTRPQTQKFLLHLVQMHENGPAEYRERIREYQRDGIPEAFDSEATGRLAKATLALGLDPV